MIQTGKKYNGKRLFGLTRLQVKTITLVVILALWEILPTIGLINTIKLPRPSRLSVTFWELATVGYPKGITIWLHIKATIWRILRGYILATIFAIPLGLFIGNYYLLERAANPIITFARSVATISLLPLAIAWFGIGEASRVLLIMYGSFWAILTNTIQGVKSVDITFLNVGRMFGANRRVIFFRVVLPATLPRIFAGMKIALGVAFMVIIAVEMIGTVKGLGALIQQSRFFYSSKIAIDGMIIIGIFGLIISIGLDYLEKIMLPWAVGLEEVKR
ncbi:MAG: ABC transporter permease [Planctomycetota bacterium]|jgi:ABC-type nitrate/sulfonate/bicarbonate transport system permease component